MPGASMILTCRTLSLPPRPRISLLGQCPGEVMLGSRYRASATLLPMEMAYFLSGPDSKSLSWSKMCSPSQQSGLNIDTLGPLHRGVQTGSTLAYVHFTRFRRSKQSRIVRDCVKLDIVHSGSAISRLLHFLCAGHNSTFPFPFRCSPLSTSSACS
ncbi:hypothetical protein BV25DRAFT_1041936 [Artomyces pyxidatus]|uniref:Uncharacterized protein n=1 Tax=Artomyces pyxidatus TaxID=48021 RepID=A0ACB8SUV9_9AGAM|nr:hypothetical protein BV25DRAFT_1041936 [Artomyces pyxidatus]